MKKSFLVVGIILVVLIVGFFIGRHLIARRSVEYAVERMTGFPLEIGSLRLGLFMSELDLRDIKLMNPPEFEERLFLEIPRLYADYRLATILSREPHVNEMILDIGRVMIVKNKKGRYNVAKLKGVSSSSKKDSGKDGETTKYQIDLLRLKIREVTLKRFDRAKPSERKFKLNIDTTFKNITDTSDINRLIMLTLLKHVPLPGLGLSITQLRNGLGNVVDVKGVVLKGATKVLEKKGKELLKKKGKGLFDALKKATPKKN